MTATSDIVDRFGEGAQVCSADLRSFGGRPAFEGPIRTVRCFEDNLLVRNRLSESGNGDVLVVDAGGSARVALMGEIVASLARDNGWSGVVVNGRVRDVAALRGLYVGIVALGACPRASGKTGEGETDLEVAFGGVTFRPGAMLYRDDDGIVVVDR